jgi:predicted thioesterase
MAVEPGLSAVVEHTVCTEDTAESIGSGDVPVLGTPRLLALAEAATVAAVAGHLPAGRTSVGTRVELDHLAATPVGVRVRVRAELAAVDGRTLRFGISASATAATTGTDGTDGADAVIARGTVTRAVVDRDRFLSTL